MLDLGEKQCAGTDVLFGTSNRQPSVYVRSLQEGGKDEGGCSLARDGLGTEDQKPGEGSARREGRKGRRPLQRPAPPKRARSGKPGEDAARRQEERRETPTTDRARWAGEGRSLLATTQRVYLRIESAQPIHNSITRT